MQDTYFDPRDQVLINLIDVKKIASSIEGQKELLFENVQKKIYNRILNMSPHDTFSFYLSDNDIKYKDVEFGFSIEYAAVLANFLLNHNFNEYKIDSIVTPVVLGAITDSIMEFYSDKIIISKLSQSINEEFSEDSPIIQAVRDNMGQNAKWLHNQMRDIITSNIGHSITPEMEAQIIQNITTFIHSSAGAALIGVLSKFMASGMAKVIVPKIAAAVGKVVLSSTFKSIIVSVIKKIGVTTIIKSSVGKVIIAFFTVIGIPIDVTIAALIIIIIGGIMLWEYDEMPRKLAEKVPGEVTSALKEQFTGINQLITEAIVSGVLKEIAQSK